MTKSAVIPRAPSDGLVTRFAERFGVDSGKMLTTLKATAFKVKDGEATNEQMMALMIVADQYKLNPFTREIFAFPDTRNGIVPVVSVDGWCRIINEHPQLDGIEFIDGPEENGIPVPAWIECIIYRKDRKHPTKVRERFKEVKRGTQPWASHPSRMLRHKALIQCSRVAFGFAGIYDQDEAERIVEMGAADVVKSAEVVPIRATELPPYPQEQFEKNLAAWRGLISSGAKSSDQIIAMVSSKYTMSEEQKQQVTNPIQPATQEAPQ